MTGRGVDQVLPHPGDPHLWEGYVRDAQKYVQLAEAVNGPIPRPVEFAWPWGDALRVLDDVRPNVRLINLETSVTRSDDVCLDKGVHYRMNPANVPVLTVARPDVCALANNHVLDFGRRGLLDTLDALAGAGIAAAGAGQSAALPVSEGIRVLVFSFAHWSSGVPPDWAATGDRPGVEYLPDLSPEVADELAERVRQEWRLGDLVVASIHWGSNWGYRVGPDQIEFAHRLIDGGFDVVHGHSSHHPRPIEVYRGKLILYGCGDFIDDYEGIGGHEEYRDDLRLMYFASLEPDTGRLVRLSIVPLQARQMRLHRASTKDSRWLQRILNDICTGVEVTLEAGGSLQLTL